ncbi:MAG TPA: hypothetical protein VK604_05090 [Bryobacteraceae bacterium]|jgi:hypothetical protein|nr:hypothetical protein [Bryobacteraceae bacterium]
MTEHPITPKQSSRRRSVSRKSASKHPVIDNRKYPSTEDVGKILNVPATRVQQLKELAAQLVGR